MNCQEVMDYMQRQLDGDLDEQEADVLNNHTRHCQECERMYARLQLLSAGLENLPKVTPGYSLVDAILPRLAELSAGVAADQPDSAPVQAGNAEPVEPAWVPTSRTNRIRTGKRWTGKMSLGALGGVIAAGIAAGLFVVSMHLADPLAGRNNSADAGTMTANSAASSADKATGSSQAFGAAQADALHAGQEQAGNDKSDKVKADSFNSFNGGGAESKPAAPAEKSATGMTEQDQSGSPAPDEPAAADSYDSNRQSERNFAPNYEQTFTAGNGTDNSAAQTPSDGEANAAKDAPQADGNTASGADAGSGPDAKTGTGADEGASSSSKSAQPDAKQGVTATSQTNYNYNLADVADLQEAVSPDGVYKAVIVDGGVLRIYTVSDGTLLFESQKRPGGIHHLQWAADSAKLSYVTAADGKPVVYTVAPKDGTEQVTGK